MFQSCKCLDRPAFDMPFSMAFQPIFDLGSGAIFAREALVRGINGEDAQTILSQVDEGNRHAFDQQCRVKAIEMAATWRDIRNGAGLSINFLPHAVYEPRPCLRLTLEAAQRAEIPLNQIIFEFTDDQSLNIDHVLHILTIYREFGFKTAIDDFGAGFAGLTLLPRFQPDLVKIDMDLIRGIDTNHVKQTILKSILVMLSDFGIVPICEGIETPAELATVQDLGVCLVQGYLLGRPVFNNSPIDSGLPHGAA